MLFYERTQTILILIIPGVFSIPFPQQNVSSNESYESPSKNRILYLIFGIVGIAVFLEIIYWMFRCFSLAKRGNDSGIRGNNSGIIGNNSGIIGNNNDDDVHRRRGLFDIPSYVGSV